MKRKFHLGDVLSITTGKLVSTRHVTGIYDILSFMTRDSVYTHQIPRVWDECKPWVLRQHPQIADVDGKDVTSENWQSWLKDKIARFGEELEIEQIPVDDHTRIDPIKEAVDMFGADRVIVVKPEDLARE